jgi:hypothetical protein
MRVNRVAGDGCRVGSDMTGSMVGADRDDRKKNTTPWSGGPQASQLGSEGVTARVPGSFEVPAELRLEIDVGPTVRTGLRADVDRFPASAFRRGGSILSPSADALGVSGFVRVGRASPCGCPGHMGRGYFFAVERREVMRSAWLD